jgi:hypothetical protein
MDKITAEHHSSVRRAAVHLKLKALIDACAPHPYFHHDCDACKFHGTVDENVSGSGTFDPVDVYVCERMTNIGFSTILLRHGDKPGENRTIDFRAALDKFYHHEIHGNVYPLSD